MGDKAKNVTLNGLADLAADFVARLGDESVVTERAALRTYECDGLAAYRCIPGLVVLPRTTDEGAYVVKRGHDAGIPFVARGAGPGLSGGALPREDGVLVVLSRMSRIREVDVDDQRAVVGPGASTLNVPPPAGRDGFYYAPDPS